MSLTYEPSSESLLVSMKQLDFFINNLLVRIHSIIQMMWWTGLAPRDFDLIDNLLVRIPFIIEMIWWTGLAPWAAPTPGVRKSDHGEYLW